MKKLSVGRPLQGSRCCSGGRVAEWAIRPFQCLPHRMRQGSVLLCVRQHAQERGSLEGTKEQTKKEGGRYGERQELGRGKEKRRGMEEIIYMIMDII